MKVELWDIDRPKPYDSNPRKLPEKAIKKVAASIKEFGFRSPVVVDEQEVILAGHTRLEAAKSLGLKKVPVHIAEGLTPAQARAYRIADNRVAQETDWLEDALKIELGALDELGFDLDLTGFDARELAALMQEQERSDKEDIIPEVGGKAISKCGDVWVLGRHRLACGDCTSEGVVELLLQGAKVDLICNDPPYCSGGFQESGKSAGSVGTDAAHKQIANDRLSTRGYQALLSNAFRNFGAPFLLAFTDWRMWTYLFDLSESTGYGVRSMIIWDKATPGMGRGWRAQHELVLWGAKETPPYEKKFGGAGNVITLKRQKNELHTTQKPVELLETMIHNTPFATNVADPFSGSGTTLIACENTRRTFYGVELDPLYVDVIVKRWQEYTGNVAILEGDTRGFDEISSDRRKPVRLRTGKSS